VTLKPWVVELLHAVGLTDLADDEVRLYRRTMTTPDAHHHERSDDDDDQPQRDHAYRDRPPDARHLPDVRPADAAQ
jgi:hypothetical protein